MATYKTLTNRPPTSYHKDTPETLQAILEGLIHTQKRVRLFYGHTTGEKAGQDWHEENNVSGYLGRSTGSRSIVILLPTKHSSGGPSILDDCIVSLLVDGQEVYKHPQYRNGEYKISPCHTPTAIELRQMVTIDGVEYARFGMTAQAERWIDFMTGARMAK